MRVTVSLSLVGCVAAVAANSQSTTPKPGDLLASTLRASVSVPLRGVSVTMRPGPEGERHTVARRVVRDGQGRSLDVCLSPEAERGFATQHNLQWTRVFDPQNNTLRVKRAQPIPRSAEDIQRRVRLVRSNFRAKVVGREQIAGRAAWRLDLSPLYPGGHRYLLCIDAKTGVELCREETDETGAIVNLTLFRSIEFPTSVPGSDTTLSQFRTAKVIPLADAPSGTDLGELQKQAGFPLHLPTVMPDGYTFENCQLAVVEGHRVACLRYSDGIATLTVCQGLLDRPVSQVTRTLIPLPFGELMIDSQHHNRRTMVIGHAGTACLTAVAESLQHPREAEWLTWLTQQYRMTMGELNRWRQTGMSLDAITALKRISQQTGTPMERLRQMYASGFHWRDIAQQYRVSPASIQQQITQRIRR